MNTVSAPEQPKARKGRGGGRRGRAAAIAVVVAATVLVLVAWGGAPSAHASGLTVTAPRPTSMVLAVNDLPTIVANLRTWVMGILAGVATLFLTIGGVRYVMAGGDPSEVERAKAAFRSAAVGYVLAVIAPVVLTVLKSIIGG